MSENKVEDLAFEAWEEFKSRMPVGWLRDMTEPERIRTRNIFIVGFGAGHASAIRIFKPAVERLEKAVQEKG